jgi:phenylacetate-CoA ligase
MSESTKPIPELTAKAKEPVCGDDPEFCRWFKRLCISDLLIRAEKDPLYWQGRPLNWDASHEIYAYYEYAGRRIPLQRLLVMSNCRRELMDRLWPKTPLTRQAVERFYQISAHVLPWGHGQFKSNHDVAGRQQAWLRRVRLLQMLKQHQVRSLCDYGAGCGYTTLLAATMGFDRVIHYEYSAFQPYVKWRSERMSAAEQGRGHIEWYPAEQPFVVKDTLDAIICTDVAEHVWDPYSLVKQINQALASSGLLVWASCFGEGLSSHLHPHLKGKEDQLLAEAGFEYLGPLPDPYVNHCGLYRKIPAKTQTRPNVIFSPHTKLQTLEHSQWLSRDELAHYQWTLLQSLLNHAYARVPYYRKQWQAAGLTPRDIKTPGDFSALPILTKAQIQDNINLLCADSYLPQDLRGNTTGGSTGQPLLFYRDRNAQEWIKAAKQRFRNWMGYNESIDKVAFMWGADRDIPILSNQNHRWLNAFNCSETDIKRFIEQLVHWQPKAIRGYASCLALAARLIRQNDWLAPRPQVIESAAEKIHPEERRLVEEVFQCPVYEVYGSREIPALACECSAHNGMHIFSDLRWVEVLDKDGRPAAPGQQGRLIVTDLVNYGMPFIRYEIGDIGVLSEQECSCGRKFGLLKEIKGRISDMICTPDGRIVHGEYFSHVFYHVPGVQSFQVCQKSLRTLILWVVPNADFNAAALESAIQEIKHHLGGEIQIRSQLVEQIPKTKSGKRRFVISELDHATETVSSEPAIRRSPASERGIVYVAFGKEYDKVAAHTACYSRQFTDLPFYVLTNLKERSEKWNQVRNVEFRYIDEPDSSNRAVRTSVVNFSPFEQTLVMDCDAVVRRPGIERIFDYLERSDLVFVELMKFPKVLDSFFEKFYKPFIDAFSISPESLVCGAVFAFKKTDFSESFFRRWNALWTWAGKTRDMPPLMGVLETLTTEEKNKVQVLSNDERTLRVLNFDPRGICCDDDTSIIHHRFKDKNNTWFKRYDIPLYSMNKPWDKPSQAAVNAIQPSLNPINSGDSNAAAYSPCKNKTIALIVSIPQRAAQLRYVLSRIALQVDEIRILLNGCDTVPDDLRTCRKISQIETDPSGHLYASAVWKLLQEQDDGYIFILDDDIAYPADYVKKMIARIDHYQRKAAIVVYGMDFTPPFQDCRDHRKVYHFFEPVADDRIVDAGGVGTLAFHTSTLRPHISDFPNPDFRDLWFAILAARQNIPIICTAREKDWLQQIQTEGQSIWMLSAHPEWRQRKNEVFRTCLLPLLQHKKQGRPLHPLKSVKLSSKCSIIPSDPPLISVIMPAYNAERFIREAIDSVLAQTFEHFELIVVDDGSSDHTVPIIESIHDPRLRLIRQEHQYTAAATNRAIQEARGQYILGVDSDDKIEPDYLRQLVETANAYPDFDYYYPEIFKLMDADGRFQEPSWHYRDFSDTSILPAFLFTRGFLPIPHPGALKRRTMFERTGLYRDQKNLIDFEFMTRNALNIRFKRAVNAIGYCYRWRSDSISRQMEHRNRHAAAALEAMLDRYAPEILCPPLMNVPTEQRRIKFLRFAIGVFENHAKRHAGQGGQFYHCVAERLWRDLLRSEQKNDTPAWDQRPQAVLK